MNHARDINSHPERRVCYRHFPPRTIIDIHEGIGDYRTGRGPESDSLAVAEKSDVQTVAETPSLADAVFESKRGSLVEFAGRYTHGHEENVIGTPVA